MEQTISGAVKALFGTDIDVTLTRPASELGDYATNVALQLAGKVGKNPRDIAEAVADKLRDEAAFSEVSVAGPGFINLRLSDETLLGELHRPLSHSRQGQTVVIETNNPNPFKAMHIGHAFNAVLGDTLANLIEAAGARTYRVSYHGDVGLHVGKSMYSLLRYADGSLDKLIAIPEPERNSFMSRMYAEGSKAYKEDPAAKREIDDLAAQSFEPKSGLYVQVYDLCKSWSFQAIDRIVSQLGNRPTERRFLESEADMRGVPIVQKNVPKVFQESDGALVFKGSEHGAFDNAFVASNGRGLYAARDLGLMQLKNEQYHPDKSYIVTAEEQRDYFKGVIAAAELCDPTQKDVTVNISTGTVKLTTGKMSSRDGDVVEISWLFDQVAEAITARGGEPTEEIVAGALRYQFLKVKIGSDVIFDINEAVSLTGNTGSYLQYAHARARRILEKATTSEPLTHVRPEDRTLVRKLGEFHDVLKRTVADLQPHLLCGYLFELAQEFNRYYETNQVVGSEQEAHRAGLVAAYADTLARGLAVLGIHAPEKM